MNIQKFGKSLIRALRHLQFAGQVANPKARLLEAGNLLTEAHEEIDQALLELERADASQRDQADLREAATQVLEAIQLVTGVHARIA